MLRRFRAHLVAFVVYTLFALVVTFPMPLHFSEYVIANGPGQVDAYLGIWNIWWAAQALTTLQDPFITPLLFYPQGLDLFWQTLSLPQGILALPITLIFGPLPAYNFLILASFVLGGYCTFLLIRAILRDDPSVLGDHAGSPVRDLAALVGGAVYAFAPFHLQKVLDAQLEVAAIQWLPLWAWATWMLLERRQWRYVILAAAALLWVGLGTWYYGLFALIATGAMTGLWALGREEPRTKNREPRTKNQELRTENQTPRTENREPRIVEGQGTVFGLRHQLSGIKLGSSAFSLQPSALVWGSLPILLWFMVMTPRLLDLAQRGDELLGDARVEQIDAVADLVSFWLPNPNHPLWGASISQWYQAHYPEAILWNVSLGIVGTVLALIGVWFAWRTQWRWMLLGTLAAAFALGGELHAFGVKTEILMPYALIRDLPGVRSSHRPNHFVLITILTTAIYAAYGVLALLRRFPRRPAVLVGGVLTLLLAIDGWAGSLPLFQRPMPQPYRDFPAPSGAILPVPLHLNFSNSENLWYQTEHRWPIIGGFIGREPPYPIGRYLPGINEMRFGSAESADILSPGWPELARESLAAYDIRYVMFHKDAMGSSLPLMTDLIAEMGLTTSYDDALIGVYPVPEPETLRPLAYLGGGWDKLERDGDRRWRWMGDQAAIHLINPDVQPRVIVLDLDFEAFEQARPLTFTLGDGAPFTIEVSRARMQRSLRLILPPGETMLYLDAPADRLSEQSSRRLSIAMMGVTVRYTYDLQP